VCLLLAFFPHGDPQLGASGSRIPGDFLIVGRNRLLCQGFPNIGSPERLFDPPVFQRVEADYSRSSARFHDSRQCREQSVERSEFIVHGNSQCLEHPGCGVHSTKARDATSHKISQLCRGCQWLCLSLLDDLAGDASAIALLTIFPEYIRKRDLTESIHQVGRGFAAGWIESHIERPIVPEAESSTGLFQLVRAEPEVCQDAIDGGDSEIRQDIGQLIEVRMNQGDWKSAHPRSCEVEHIRILVESDQTTRIAQFFSNESGVPSGSDRAIDPGFSRHGIEESESFRRQHRKMPGLTFGGHTVFREAGQGEGEPGGEGATGLFLV
jgi:hypothetical protein